MTAGEISQLITSLATLIGVVSGLILSLRNRSVLHEVREQTNGITKALVEATEKTSFAAGEKSEKGKQVREEKRVTARLHRPK